MSKMVKEMIVDQLRSRYGDLDSAVVIELLGCDGITTNDFRRSLRAKNMRMEVVKNSLLKRAVQDRPLKPLAQSILGSNALVTGGESPVEVAKLIEEWMPKIAGLKLKAAILDGEYLNESQVKGLVKMPTRRDLQARIAATVRAPGARLAGALLSGGGRIAGCLKALIEKLEESEPSAAASA